MSYVRTAGCRERPPRSLLIVLLTLGASLTSVAQMQDEAKKAGKTVKDFTPPKYDYLPDMDWVAETGGSVLPDALLRPGVERKKRRVGAPALGMSAAIGRNTWMLWCGGNERFWDWLATKSYGFMDLLKLLDSRKRATRWTRAGLVNEPGMRPADEPDEYGLWLDVPEDPDRREPPEDIYGRSSGVVGLRLFKNPAFASYRSKWKAAMKDGYAGRYYDDPAFFQNRDLVRPYRVGMSCAFCHASAHPLNPPSNPAEPEWANISGSIGSQYLRIRAVFGSLLKEDNFIYHVLDSQPPGTIDTSLIASDGLNNPNTMNAIFAVPQRVRRAGEKPLERVSGPSSGLPVLDSGEKKPYPKDRPVPHILLDGADSVGVWGALARVYLNIGTFSEQWLTLHNPLVGGVPQKPFKIEDCKDASVYWEATRRRVEPLRDYFLRITTGMPLLDARGVPDDAVDVAKLARGRRVFARNCIACHSSIQPESDYDSVFRDDGTPPDAAFVRAHRAVAEARRTEFEDWRRKGELWDHEPGTWFDHAGYRAWADEIVEKPWFWRQNYLSTDMRIPVNYVRTNSARALATNGIKGHMWEDFTSESFQNLPSIGRIEFFNPYKPNDGGSLGADDAFTPRHPTAPGVPSGGGGPGFYRPPTLVSIWATAPFLHNNSLGLFNNDPSVQGRLEAFQDAIEKLLWPDKRLESSDYADPDQLRADHGLIWRTDRETYLTIPGPQIATAVGRLPTFLSGMVQDEPGWLEAVRRVPWLPSVVLLLVAYLLLRRLGSDPVKARRKRWAGVTAIGAALVIGFLLYFIAGRLSDLKIGPIPKGTPVNLLANINTDDKAATKKALKTVIRALAEIKSKKLSDADAAEVMRERVAPALIEASRCPDFVMDKGHYFPWFDRMSDEDKRCLIELLKTL